jgi:hypothetical protein
VAAKLARLRQQLADSETVTSQTIEPLASLAAAAERAKLYRRLVDQTLRQPFLGGARPSPELVQRVKESHSRWGEMAGAIRAGKPPRSVSKAAFTTLSLPDVSAASADAVPMTGALWAKMSDEYFKQTLALENLGADLGKHVRRSPKMQELAQAMNKVEQTLALAAAATEPGIWPRALAWQLHRVRQLGLALQIKLQERDLTPDPDLDGVENFLRDMDAARGLRHRGISLSREGGAPPPNDAPAVLVRAPAEGTIRASIADAETSVEIAPQAPDRLPQLAAELYHVHYLLRKVEDFEHEDGAIEREMIESSKSAQERAARLAEHLQSQRTRIAERQRDYEGRRLQVIHEMTEEADRVLAQQR